MQTQREHAYPKQKGSCCCFNLFVVRQQYYQLQPHFLNIFLFLFLSLSLTENNKICKTTIQLVTYFEYCIQYNLFSERNCCIWMLDQNPLASLLTGIITFPSAVEGQAKRNQSTSKQTNMKLEQMLCHCCKMHVNQTIFLVFWYSHGCNNNRPALY